MPKGYQKVCRRWTEVDAENAIHSIQNGASIRSAAKEFGMTESMLRKRMIRIKEGREGIIIEKSSYYA